MDGSIRVAIAGGGRVGRQTAELLDDRGHDVVVIESDPVVANAISDSYVATVIEGDATIPQILTQADLERTDVFAALTGVTGANLAICMMVEQLSPETHTVMRTKREHGESYGEFVDEVIFPERAGARAAANVIEPGVIAIEDLTGELDILEIHVTENGPVAGRTLDELALPRGALIISAAAGNTIAGSDTVLEPGKSYIVAAEPDVVDEVINLMRG